MKVCVSLVLPPKKPHREVLDASVQEMGPEDLEEWTRKFWRLVSRLHEKGYLPPSK